MPCACPIEEPAFLLKLKQSKHSSALAKGRLKKMVQHQPRVSRTLVVPPRRLRPHFPPAWMKVTGGVLTAAIISGGLALYLHLLPIQSASPPPKSGAIAISQATTQYQTPTPTPSLQYQIPTPTPASQSQTPTPTPASQSQIPTPTPASQPQIPTPTPPVISPAIPAGRLLYSTSHPYSACDKQGGHWIDTSDARVTCKPSGSKIINTLEYPAIANLGQLGGDQSPWPGQNFIVQVQVTVNPHSYGAFGIDFLPETSDNTQGHFAYLLSPPNDWAFNYYDRQGNLVSTLISGQLLSPVSTKLTIDIRVEGTYYTFYINGVDTTGRAITGPQYINKIVGLAVDKNADITFSNFAIYALS